jgi:hypothetical protein
MSGPVDATDPKQTVLIAAGMDTLAFNIDLGAAWTEASRTFALDLGTAELGGLLKASARVALANVPFGQSAAGGDRGCANRGRDNGDHAARYRRRRPRGGAICRHPERPPHEARRAIVDSIRATGATVMATSPDAAPIVGASARFMENPVLAPLPCGAAKGTKFA